MIKRAEEVGRATKEVVEESKRASQEAASRVEEVGRAAREAAEESKRASQEAASRAEEISKSTMDTIATWATAYQEVINRSRQASKSAEEAAEISARASQEAIKRAEEASKTAREIAEASMRAAKEVTEASRRGAGEAAEAWAKVFSQLIAGSEEKLGKIIKQTARRTAEAPARRWQEAESKTSEIGPKEAVDPLASAFEQMTSGVERTKSRRKKEEVKKPQTSIEGRLESLAQMFSADKDMPSEEDTEEEES